MFNTDLERGKIGEEMFAASQIAKGNKVIDVSDQVEYQKQDIDFILEDQRGNRITAEVKTDYKSEETGNLFIETDNLASCTLGWWHYCKADYLVFVQPNKRIAHIIPRAAITNINIYTPVAAHGRIGRLLPVGNLKQIQGYVKKEL